VESANRPVAIFTRSFPTNLRYVGATRASINSSNQAGSEFMRPSVLAPRRRSPLRTRRDHRRAHHTAERRRTRFQQPVLSIHQRPSAPEDRPADGPWEGDVIVGTKQGSAIVALDER
jgi:IS30 family transposase